MLEGGICLNMNKVVQLLIIPEHLRVARLERHQKDINLALAHSIGYKMQIFRVAATILHADDIRNRSIHLIEANDCWFVIFETPQADVQLFTDGQELPSRFNLHDICYCLSMKAESCINKINLINLQKDDRTFWKSQSKESVRLIRWIFSQLFFILFLHHLGIR